MSVTSDFWKELKKLEEEDKAKQSVSTTKVTGGSGKKPSGSVSSDFWNELAKDDDVAPIFKTTRTTKSILEKEKKKKDRKWFDTKLFDDGYDFGDVTKTILGTGGDILENLASGVAGMGEKAVDTLAYIAPFAANAQFYQNGMFDLETEKKHRETVEQSKKDIGEWVAKDLYDEEALVKNASKAILGVDMDDYSILGEKSDSLVQSGGQLLATAGLQAVGVPWFLTTGATSFGSEAENAMNQGASYEEAGASAAISAGAEILSEKLSGGILFGGKALDDVLTKQISRSISNKAARTFAKLGLDMVGEGSEEIFSQVASNLGSALYKDESLGELLLSEEAFDEYLESFIGGAVLGGVSGGYKAVTSKTDYASGLTANEQKVVDQIYNERVSEAGKVSQKEKSKIYDQILSEMEKGYISTDDIERILGGESYNTYHNTVESEDSVLKEFEELGKKQNATLAEQSRYAELKEQVKNIRENSQRSQLRTKLSEDVLGMLKGDRLVESYNERSRRGQVYEADLTKYDSNQQKVIQKAVESGVLNNTRRTHEFVDIIAKISADKGVLFDFTNNAKLKESGFAVEGKQVNGYVTKDGITLNIDSPKAWQSTVGHEITHVLEGTELYNELQKAIFDYAKPKGEYLPRYNSLKELYKDVYKDLSAEEYDAKINTEITADLVGDLLFQDADFINNLSTTNRNVFQKIYDEIKYLYKVVTAGSKEARELEKVKKAFDKAYREGSKTQTDTKYSISDKNIKDISTGYSYGETYYTMSYTQDGKTVATLEYGEYDGEPNVKMIEVDPEYRRKGIATKLMQELQKKYPDVEINFGMSTPDGTKLLDSITYDVTDETVVAERQKLKDLQTELNELQEKLDVLYDTENLTEEQDAELHKLGDRWQEVYETIFELSENLRGKKATRTFVKTDTKYSLSDSDGRQLTAEQQEYFKDSAIRDKDGNLMVLYHGTQNAFTVFDIGRSGENYDGWSEYGEGIYLTPEKKTAQYYGDNAGRGREVNLMEMYADIKNPFSTNDPVDFDISDLAQKYELTEFDERFMKKYGNRLIEFLNHHNESVRDYLTSKGFDGVWETIDGDVYQVIAYAENQVKNVDNRKPTENPDIRYSLSEDSDGNKLTEEQDEYFKKSKMRDDNGNLMVMYHGTPNGDFTVFKDGTYFTASKEYADRYQNPGASSISTGKVASNPKTFEVYLDIKKPFDINDAEAREIYINDYIKGGNAMGINPYLSDAEYAKINTIDWTEGEDLREFLIENEYDYDGLVLDEGATGGYGDEVKSRGKSYVVFSPEQVKNIDNQSPTSDPDIRFSLSKPVEETKDLMALHNLTEQKLLKSLKLGGLPMPSVAIAKAKDGHSEFGEISLILPKETIDPQSSSRNKLYSGDAWTPTYPKVEYKLNSKALKQIRDKINGLVPANVQEFGRLHLDSDNMEDTLNRYNGDMVDAFKDNDALKYAYLMEAEADVQLPMKEKNLSYSGSRENGAIVKVAETISAEDINKALNGGSQEIQKLEPIVRKAVAEYVRETYGDDQFILDTFAPAEGLSFSDLDGYLVEARKYQRNGIEQTVDSRPARQLIRDMTVQYSYEEWLRNLFSGIVEKEGIRNNKDYFTPSGNRRSFEALHYEHNLENVIKAMREKGEKGIGFGGGSIFGAATTEFSSVDEMKQASGRLQQMSEEEYQEIKDGFTQRFFDLASSLPNDKKSFIATDDAANTLTEAVSKYQTRSGIANYLRRELKGWATYSPQVVDDLIELVNDIRSMPTGYFEAKPQRAVGFDEVGVFVIPKNASYDLRNALHSKGYPIAEYDPDVEGDRTRVLNQFEDLKFSLSNVGEEHKRYGNWNVYNRYATPATELRFEAPVAENSTEQAETQLLEENSTVANLETVEFPDDLAPVQTELDDLMAEADGIASVMEAYASAGDIEGVNRLLPEYEAIKGRIRELQMPENERVSSLGDSDAPPEMEAPFYGESEPVTVDNPFEDRNWDDVVGRKNRSVNAYMYEHPEVKPFFQAEAQALLGEFNDTQRGERIYNDEIYYASGGEMGWTGIKRLSSESMETMLDDWGMSYDEIERGLNAIIKDNGAENISAAKKVEFMLNDRLLNGYKNFYDKGRIEPNQEYIKLINEMQITSYSDEARRSLFDNADAYAPIVEETSDVAPVKPVAKQTPSAVTKVPKTVKGKTPPKPNPKVAKVLTEESQITKKKPGIMGKLASALVDKGMVFENYSHKTGNHEIQAKWNSALSSNTSKKAQYFMENGAKGVPALKNVLERVNKSGKKKAFFDYLYHAHNVDRMSREERFHVPNKTVFGETITADVSRGKVKQYERANPEFKNWAKDIYAINKHMRGLLLENNLISPGTYSLWEKMYPHYVPIGRVDVEGKNISVPLDTRKTGVNAPVKRAEGGNSDMRPLDVVLAERIEQTYSAIARNSFGIELKNTMGTTINSQDNKAGVDEAIDIIEAQEDHLLKAGTMSSNPTFTVFENGKRVEFEITEDMYDALKPAGMLGYRNQAIKAVGDARRNLLTQWNPVFALYRNPIKDLQEVAINSQHAVKTYLNIPNAIYQIATDGRFATEYHQNGGKGNSYFDGRTKKFKVEDNAFKKVIGMPIRAIENAGEFIEEIPRLAEYIASRKEGRSIDRSMLDAARVTTNFAAGGDFTKFLNSHGFTFLNASVQGASQHVRNFREAKEQGLKGYVKVLAKYTVAGLPGILLNNLLWDDDEDYEELNDYVKQNYYVVAKTEDGKFVRIPKGRTAAVMQNAMEQMQNLVTGDDEADFGTFFELFMNNIAPNNPIENNILAPIFQAVNNEAWYGGDLVPSRLQKLPAEEQFDESTDDISKWLGEKTGLSPYKINYLIDQYSGGLGDMILPTLTPEAESGDNSLMGNILAPWKKEITTDKVLNNKNPGDFYDLRDELEKKANSSKATEEDYMRNMYMDSVSWEMSDLYKQKREVQSSDLPDDEKYEEVRDIQEQINAIAENALNNYSHVTINGLYSEAGDRRYNKDAESGKWYEIREKDSDGSDNYYYQQEQRVTKALGISYEEYWNNREEYDYAYDKPEKYAIAKAVGGYDSYMEHYDVLENWHSDSYLRADKDSQGNSISGSRKEKVIEYINGLDIDYGERIILYRTVYESKADKEAYNMDIINYLNSRDDISYDEMKFILEELGMEVDDEGNVSWD